MKPYNSSLISGGKPYKGKKMGRWSKKIKDRAIEISESDDYQKARDDAFDDQFRDFVSETKFPECITEDDVQGFLDSFTFDDEDEWAMNKACNEVDDYYDAKYEEEKDRRMGL